MLSVHSEQGPRPFQEDRYVVEHIDIKGARFLLMAVMDGFGGSEASQKVAEMLPETLSDASRRTEDITQAFLYSVAMLDIETRNYEAGTTLSMAAIPDSQDMVYVANLGDSPILMYEKDNRTGVMFATEHNARSNIQERQAAEKAGAVYDEYLGGYLRDPATGARVQLTRALGAGNDYSFLNRTPETWNAPLDDKSFVVVGSDGLTSNHWSDYQYIANQVLEGANAEVLVRDALNRNTDDNVTAIVWRPN